MLDHSKVTKDDAMSASRTIRHCGPAIRCSLLLIGAAAMSLAAATGCQSSFDRARTDGRMWRQPLPAARANTNTYGVGIYGGTSESTVSAGITDQSFPHTIWGETGGPVASTWGNNSSVGVWEDRSNLVGIGPNSSGVGRSGERLNLTGVNTHSDNGVSVGIGVEGTGISSVGR